MESLKSKLSLNFGFFVLSNPTCHGTAVGVLGACLKAVTVVILFDATERFTLTNQVFVVLQRCSQRSLMTSRLRAGRTWRWPAPSEVPDRPPTRWRFSGGTSGTTENGPTSRRGAPIRYRQRLPIMQHCSE